MVVSVWRILDMSRLVILSVVVVSVWWILDMSCVDPVGYTVCSGGVCLVDIGYVMC